MLKYLVTISLSILFLNYPTIGQEIKLSVQTGHSSTINELKFSPDGAILASAGSDNNIILWDVNTGKQMTILSGHTNKVTDISFHPTDMQIATSSLDGSVIIWTIPDGVIVTNKEFNNSVFSIHYDYTGTNLIVGSQRPEVWNTTNDIIIDIPLGPSNTTSIAFNSTGDAIALSGEGGLINVYSYPDLEFTEKFKLNSHRISFSNDDQFLFAAGISGKLKRWKLGKKGLFNSYTLTANRIWHSYHDVEVNDEYFIGSNKDHLISVYKHKNGKLKYSLKGHNDEVRAMAIHPNGQLLASSGRDKKIQLWDLNDGSLISTFQGIGVRVNAIQFDQSGQNLLVGYDDGSFKYCNISDNGNIISNSTQNSWLKKYLGWETTILSINNLDPDNQEAKLILGFRKKSKKIDGEYSKYKTGEFTWNLTSNTFEEPKLKSEKVNNSSKLPDWISLQTIALPEKDNGNSTNPTEWKYRIIGNTINIDGNKKLTITTSHTDSITTVSFNPKFNYLATGSWDGLIKFWNLDTGEEMLSYAAFGTSDYIYITPENYYFATKGALDGVGFLTKGRLFSFDQFDVKYNRPDLVFKTLPYIPSQLVSNYLLAYQKRLKKLGLEEANLTVTDDIPELGYSLGDQSLITRDREFSIDISAKDDLNKLERLFIVVNGVPEQGKKGIELNPTNNLSTKVNINLSPGVNDIQLYVMNENGVNSFRENLRVNCKVKEEDPSLYLVTIGASEFQQSEYNLTYASKDALDIEKYFKSNKLFEEVHTKSFINEDVTLSNLSSVPEFLSKAKPEDVVIISVAGHGVLDSELDYFLSTYDMNFMDPSTKGLAYEQLEDYLDATSSRKKTLLVDACHSGELDKEEVELGVKEDTEFGSVSFRNVGPSVEYKSNVSLKSSFELSKMLFADMRASNGSTVISSAGGAEYAIEGNEWNNGVFTFAFLRGLSDKAADLNGDGKIMLSEIQRYLFTEVPRITQGKQTPTSRVENLNNDFRIR